MIALVRFGRASFDHNYSYKTDIKDLKKDDLLLVQTNDYYSVAVFNEYTDKEQHKKMATKWIVQKLDVSDFEEKLFLGGFE